MAWLENFANLMITGAICTYAVYDFFRDYSGQQQRQVRLHRYNAEGRLLQHLTVAPILSLGAP